MSLISQSANQMKMSFTDKTLTQLNRKIEGIKECIHSYDGNVLKLIQSQNAAWFKEHKSELSQECRDRGERFKRHAGEIKTACESDIASFCKDVLGGHGEIWKCLKSHDGELSAHCHDATTHVRADEHRAPAAP